MIDLAKNKYKKNAEGYYYTNEPTGEYYENGKAKYKRIKALKQEELDKKVDEYRKRKMLDLSPTKMTVDQWEENWFAAYKSDCRENTKKNYEIMYRCHIKPAIGSYRIDKVKEYDCRRILSSMAEKGYSIKSVKTARCVLYSIFDKAKRNKLIADNPAEKLPARGAPQNHRRALTDDERERYLNACKTEPFGMYGAFLYWFGLRRGECLALKKSDIKDNYIEVTRQNTFPGNNKPLLEQMPKTDAGNRIIPIPNKAREYIDFDNLPNGYLFVNLNGEPLSCTEHKKRWNKFIKAALGPDTEITDHYLRHNYCCMLIEKSIPLTKIKEICGHASLQTTLDIYTHHTQTLERISDERVFDIG